MSKKSAILLVNLGTPAEPTPGGVAVFLKRFLSDPRVVEAPRLMWWFILRLIIIPVRAKRVAAAYRKIWTKEGSPIKVISVRQAEKLQTVLEKDHPENAPLVVAAEAYGDNSIGEQVTVLANRRVTAFTLVPMYPQYSGVTTGAIYDQVARLQLQSRDVPDIRIVKSYPDEPGYINALTTVVRQHWQTNARNEKLLMSFHGVPQAYVDKGDPYYEQCTQTARCLAQALDLADTEWAFSFQSRFGSRQWLQPYTDKLLEQWAVEGVKSVDVVSPAFTADCLETLEELNIGSRELFLQAGGDAFSYIPCVNDSNGFIAFLAQLARREMA